MRIHFSSDHHIDIPGNRAKCVPVDADMIVVAGDACAPGHLAIRAVRELYPDRSIPLVYVPGNHDFYSFADRKRPELKTTWEAQRLELMPRAAEECGVILLDDATVDIDGLLVVGSTLWTDLRARPNYLMYGDAVQAAKRNMNDYRLIKTGRGRGKDRLTPAQTIAAHERSVDFITRTLAEKPAEQDAIVVTHHAPSLRSLRDWSPADPRFRDLDWCYASALESLMESDGAPLLWIHGHIHQNFDYVVGATRVLSNPRGYPDLGARENPHFDPTKIVEIEPRYVPGWSI